MTLMEPQSRLDVANGGPHSPLDTANGMAPPAEYRCPDSPTPQQIREQEVDELPEVFKEHWTDLGTADIPSDRYTSEDFHRLEVETIWRRTWQFACRVEDIPRVGDSIVYDVASLSFVIVRIGETEIKAYYNSCLHRGTTLRESDGQIPELRCPFHGWSWHLDGTFKRMPSRWDFPQVDNSGLCLPEARVGVFGGFVFINPDRDAQDLEEYLAPLPEHLKRWWPWERRTKIAHAAKVIDANWKVAVNAGQEAYHFLATHPQVMYSLHEGNCQYDYWRYLARLTVSVGMPPPEDWAPGITESDMVASFAEIIGTGEVIGSEHQAVLDQAAVAAMQDVQLAPGQTAREFIAPMARQMMAQSLGVAPESLGNHEAVDFTEYAVFPNLQMELNGLVARTRPWGNDPNKCLFELMMFVPVPEGAQPPPSPPIRWLDDDEGYADVPELGQFGYVSDQDVSNMTRVQRGMIAAARSTVTVSRYQESMIRWHHHTIEQCLDRVQRVGRP